MMAAFNKLISSVLLLLATLPMIFAAYIQISETIIHRQMKEELEQKSLITIHIKSSQLIWTEKGKEASINNNMFDVEKFSITADDIQLTGLFDKDEDALDAQINSQQQKNSDATAGISVLKWLSCFYWNTNEANDKILPVQKIPTAFIQQNSFLQNPFLSCDTPPPRFS